MELATKASSDVEDQFAPLRGRVAILDGDIIAYRSAAIAEKTHYLLERAKDGYAEYHEFSTFDSLKTEQLDTDVVWKRTEDLGAATAIDAAESMLQALRTKTEPSSIEVFLSGRDSFRYRVARTKPYKGNRDYLPKPKYLRDVREYLSSACGAITTEAVEADDAIGIRAGELSANGFICTIDKDLDQIAGWHYNFVKDKVYYVSSKDAAFALYSQLLSGDTVDNIPGLPGIGKKKAADILEGAANSQELFDRTWKAYEAAKKPWDYLMEQAALVYILRTRGVGFIPPVRPDGLP